MLGIKNSGATNNTAVSLSLSPTMLRQSPYNVLWGGGGGKLLIPHIKTFSLCNFSEIPQDSTTAGSAVSMLRALMSLVKMRQYQEKV
jgi:hypothetical protein